MNYKLNCLMLLLILIIPIATASTDYSQIGRENTDYLTGTSIFNSGIGVNFDTSLLVMAKPLQPPLVVDLDGDGRPEIIIADGSTIKIFQNKTLTAIDSFANAKLTGETSILTFDIDGDSEIEIIAVTQGEQGNIMILNYSDSTLTNQTDFLIGGSYLTGHTVFNCKATDDCLIAYSRKQDVLGGQGVYATPFTSTGVGTQILLKNESGGAVGLACFPRIKHMAVQDYDKDGTKEYIFSFTAWETGSSTSHNMYIEYINGDGSTANRELEINPVGGSGMFRCGVGSTFNEGASNVSCSDVSQAPGACFTSPLVTDIDGGGTLETVIGFMKDDNEFKMRSFTSGGSLIRTYPSTFDADGVIVSNVVKANVFDNSVSGQDFCVMGYQNPTNVIDLLCASELSTVFSILGFPLAKSDEFFQNNSDPNFNLSRGYGDYNPMIHSGFYAGGDTITEFATSYGIFQPIFNFFGGSEIDIIFSLPNEQGALIPVDAEGVGLMDLLYLTATNLFYYDDRFINSDGQITSFTINPCLDSTWKVNTTVAITITVDDVDSDNVGARAILYDGISNEQDSDWSVNNTAGTSFSFSFVANETIGTADLVMRGRDVENPDSPDVITRTFSVGTNGLEFGDCVTSESFDLIPPVIVTTTTNPVDPNVEDNAITSSLDEMTGLFGLGRFLTWIVVMIVFALAILIFAAQSKNFDLIIAAGIIVIVESLLIIMGIFLGYIPFGVIITVIVVAVAVIIVWLSNKFTGSS